MKRLFLFELHKLRKQKSLYVCSAVILALLFFVVLANFILNKYLGDFIEMEAPTAVDIMLSAINSSDFILITSIFTALYACNDFSQKTIKNIYSRGFSRTEVYFVKYIICIAYTAIAFVITQLFALALGSAFFGFKAYGGNTFWQFFGQLIICLAYASIIFAIANMVQKTGVAIAIAIIAPSAVTVVTTVIDVIIQVNVDTLDADSFLFSDFWLDGMLTTLSYAAASVKKIIVSCILPVVYGSAFVVGGFYVNGRADV